MLWIVYFLGALALLPGHMVSVEERLQSERRFRPFTVLGNLKRSLKARKFLSYFGLSLLVLASALYVFTDLQLWEGSLVPGDRVRLGLMLLIVWQALLYGYAREHELLKMSFSPVSHYSCLKGLGRHGWFRLAGKATLAFAVLLLAAASLVALKYLPAHFA